MGLTVINREQVAAAVIGKDKIIRDIQEFLDVMASIHYYFNAEGLAVHEESLGEKFFDLKTGYAGDVLQKLSNYNMKMAVIGEFGKYKSKSLQDFIYECNQGNCVCFKSDEEDALSALFQK
ncbi:DUF4180 domain-containing protein [Clostridiales bacterium BAD-6]|uniref:DUF4180 domain-containing protein n=2 Tax=Sinanaerobacter chloroacetimidivorans TaxID=2818044 RepID=A0A8J7W5X4_9FIRM|nr:DUF4180 domain-containing protein [Sinanaerobacter chloroacetimidivorans]